MNEEPIGGTCASDPATGVPSAADFEAESAPAIRGWREITIAEALQIADDIWRRAENDRRIQLEEEARLYADWESES